MKPITRETIETAVAILNEQNAHSYDSNEVMKLVHPYAEELLKIDWEPRFTYRDRLEAYERYRYIWRRYKAKMGEGAATPRGVVTGAYEWACHRAGLKPMPLGYLSRFASNPKTFPPAVRSRTGDR